MNSYLVKTTNNDGWRFHSIFRNSCPLIVKANTSKDALRKYVSNIKTNARNIEKMSFSVKRIKTLEETTEDVPELVFEDGEPKNIYYKGNIYNVTRNLDD